MAEFAVAASSGFHETGGCVSPHGELPFSAVPVPRKIVIVRLCRTGKWIFEAVLSQAHDLGLCRS
jgi:hypothetical protein